MKPGALMLMLVIVLDLAPGCDRALDQRLAIVDSPRVLAIVSSPAEAKPGTPVSFSALAASSDGPVAASPSWFLCTAPKPPTEDDAVSDPCVHDENALLPIDPMAATIPPDACMQFGPDVPPGGFRPRDPDPTGGYYQPVRAELAGADLAFGFTRITCNLANAPSDVAQQYETMYIANANPVLTVDVPFEVATGGSVAITASWPAASAENYLYYDPARQALVARREAMRVSWYASAGSLPVDASAVAEDDPASSVTTMWHAPTEPQTAWLWFVLRDSRGGISVQSAAITVR
jgi:hypothetical protein